MIIFIVVRANKLNAFVSSTVLTVSFVCVFYVVILLNARKHFPKRGSAMITVGRGEHLCHQIKIPPRWSYFYDIEFIQHACEMIDKALFWINKCVCSPFFSGLWMMQKLFARLSNWTKVCAKFIRLSSHALVFFLFSSVNLRRQ